jgi:transposase
VAPTGSAPGFRLAPGLRRRGPALGGGRRQPLAARLPKRLGARLRWRQVGQGIKLFVASDKYGSLLDLELHPANTDDRAGILPTLPRLAALGFEGDLLGDSGFKGAPFAAAVLEHDIHVSVSPGGTRDGRFLPSGIRWVVERLFAWLSRYRRLNIVYDRAPDLFAAHVWIAMISIVSRRLVAQTQPQ